ncbi:hypothetical protein ABTZ57_01430 [Streptomyces sp. NPDC094048]|uniref:hypothetical protein n=1 Tax=unclassified Streptomyces TaxID=2593676 RepID=UPI00331EA0EF
MSKLELITRDGKGRPVPVGPNHPLHMVLATGEAVGSAPTEQGVAVEDVPGGANNAQLRATVNELLASLRGAGLIADGTEPEDDPDDETE